jgi:hypothetical protein
MFNAFQGNVIFGVILCDTHNILSFVTVDICHQQMNTKSKAVAENTFIAPGECVFSWQNTVVEVCRCLAYSHAKRLSFMV